ncbi:fms-related tyrosine kinase 3 ligand [Gracilinanus agilis]|uniref:fms-related tyrosine kinase 3 ligand n=1 Tax=Gracilinanus agilis TaxID=191870 RepID=UPI001CFCFA31|nr:fms-related tyrosine kinase 3 ligand [Gracilinanus agilis]
MGCLPGRARQRHEGPQLKMTSPAPAWPLTASTLVLLLLLLPWDPSRATEPPSCTFPDSPISSTFLQTIGRLSDYLLTDYPVEVPDNLQVDERCRALWHLFLAKKTLDRLELVAGQELKKLLDKVCAEISFVRKCFSEALPVCLHFRKANISHLLLDISSHLEALQPLISSQDFGPCRRLRCQPEPSTVSTLPSPGGLGALGNTSAPPKPSTFLLLALGGLPILLFLILVAAWRWKQRKRQLRPPGSPLSPIPQSPPDSVPQERQLMVL